MSRSANIAPCEGVLKYPTLPYRLCFCTSDSLRCWKSLWNFQEFVYLVISGWVHCCWQVLRYGKHIISTMRKKHLYPKTAWGKTKCLQAMQTETIQTTYFGMTSSDATWQMELRFLWYRRHRAKHRLPNATPAPKKAGVIKGYLWAFWGVPFDSHEKHHILKTKKIHAFLLPGKVAFLVNIWIPRKLHRWTDEHEIGMLHSEMQRSILRSQGLP